MVLVKTTLQEENNIISSHLYLDVGELQLKISKELSFCYQSNMLFETDW